jgi:hypothetical protein
MALDGPIISLNGRAAVDVRRITAVVLAPAGTAYTVYVAGGPPDGLYVEAPFPRETVVTWEQLIALWRAWAELRPTEAVAR